MVRISAEIVRKMRDHALRELPNECCGILSGKRGFIDRIHQCTNESASPSAFSVPPQELFGFFRSLREQGRDLMGIYHSHPAGPGTPSCRDEKEFHYRGTSYWIVSLNNELASVRCFEWGREGFAEVPYTVSEG
jgi:proteasome lid subunit RPN8/RPN11